MDFIAKQIPYTLPWDKMPVDISFIFENEKPAGKHGFLKADGEEFVFEDGTPARFWGVNFNSGANFPEHSHSEKVARRLAMTGVNLVRFHQLDAEWSTPNIFQFTKGKKLDNTQELDPQSMDRLDYLVYCLKKEGIYVYMDFLTYRRFRSGDGLENAPSMYEAAKPCGNFDKHLIELQRKFQKDFLEHVNPYTELAYKDEPCIAMGGLIPEDFLVLKRDKIKYEPYYTEFWEMYRDFAAKKSIEVKFEDWDVEEDTPLMREFITEVQMNFYKESIDYLRSIGAKFPIKGTDQFLDHLVAYCNSEAADFTDSHYYWCDFEQVDQRKFINKSMVKALDQEFDKVSELLGFMAVKDTPFFVSEWDAPWPNAYRADAALLLAAIGSLQNWCGFSIHTYRYGTSEDPAVTGKIGRSIVLGNSYYRGIFDTYNDPAKYGLFYHAALITRRRDVKAAEKTVYRNLTTEELYNRKSYRDGYDTIETGAIEQCRLRYCFNDKSEGSFYEAEHEVLSDTKEIYRNWEKGLGWIDTPKTKAVYGFIGEENLALTDVTIQAKNNYATIAMSSLTEDDICNSDNILLTAVGKADNTDSVYNNDHTTLIKEGKAPIMIDVIEAEISIKTNKKNLKVWSVDNEGFFTGVMPSSYEDGVFKFRIGEEFESMYYLIQEQ